MKSITTIMLTLLAASLLSSCDKFIGKQNPPNVDPVTMLEDQVAAERQLRAKAEQVANSRGAWQLTAPGLAVITVVAFVAAPPSDREENVMQTPYPEPDDDRPPNDPRSLPGPRHRPALKLARRMWDPAPVPKPVIDPDLDQLGWPERCAEVVRHALLSVEHWLSRGGWLREWIRLNLWLAVVLIAATVLVIPPVTALLDGVRD